MFRALSAMWLPLGLGPAIAADLYGSWTAPWFTPGLALLLSGALVVYSADRLDDARDPHHPRPATTWWPLALMTLFGCIIMVSSIVYAPQRLGLPFACICLLTVAYPLLKRLPYTKAPVVGVVWAAASILLPLGLNTPWQQLLTLHALAAACLITAGTILCDAKDAERDTQRGIGSMHVALASKTAHSWAAMLALAAALLGVLTNAWGHLFAGLAIASISWNHKNLQHPDNGPLLVDGLLVGLISLGALMV